MTRFQKSTEASTERKDVYTRVTERIINDLEQGVRPWMKPWNAEHAAGRITRPLRHNGTPYKGMNVLLLWGEAVAKGYAAPIWMTYKQAQELGGNVRKGEHGSLVVYANTVTKTETNGDGQDVEREIPFMKGYTVFNVEQVEALPVHYYAQPVNPLPLSERIEAVDSFMNATRATIPFGQVGQTATGIAKLVALPVQLMLRTRPGQAVVSKTALFGATSLQLAASWLGNVHLSFSLFGSRIQHDDDESLLIFALFVFLPWGIWQRILRLREEKLGTEPHNHWHGDGWFSFLPLPQKYIDKFVDPLVAFLAGAFLRYRLDCGLLGLWFMVGAAALLITEHALFAQAKEQYRDRRDLMKVADWDADMMSQTEQQAKTDLPKGTAVATGTDAALAAEIEKRRRERTVAEGGTK